MGIDGERMSYAAYGMTPLMYVRLTPGSSHTFFRLFAIAAKPKGQLLQTPQVAGKEYTARVYILQRRLARGFKFRITD